MIIGEALKQIFSGLTITIENRVHDVQFHYGDQKELQQWVLMRNRSKLQKYPLIWYVTNNYDQVTNDKFKVESQLILFQLTKREYLNTTRSQTTYLNSLNPLYELVNKTLKRSPFVSLQNNGKSIPCKDEPNYGVETNDPLLTSNDFAKKTTKGDKSIILDVVDAKVLRLKMIIKPYCVTGVTTFTSGGGSIPVPPTCNVPVVSGVPNNQFIDQVLVSVGVTKTWQLAGTYSPTSFDVTAGDLENWNINTATGLVSYTPPSEALNVLNTATFKATNTCGVGSLFRFIKALSYNVSVLNTPINQEADGINPPSEFPLKSFLYRDDVLAYDGTLTAYEVWVKGGIYPNWFLFANYTGSNMINNLGTQQTKINCSQTADTYLVKTRVKNSNNEYSAYTPEFSVIVP
jgi:hypothetical protein